VQLRPYQEKAISTLRSFLASKKTRVVLYAPTGSGKTCIGMDLIQRAIEKQKKVIFVCNRIELVKQTSKRISQDNIPHGIIQGSNTCMTWEPVQICSIQTIDKRGYPEADLILIDEAHGTPGSKAYQRFMEHYKTVPMIGLTATPFSKGMGKTFFWGTMWEGIIAATTIRELIDQKYLVDCDIYAPGEPDLSNVKIVAGDYQEEQLGIAVDKAELIGDIVTHWFKLANNKPTVCFATNIAHSQHIVEQFILAGVKAEHIDCYTSDDDRRRILDRVFSGETKIISNVGILSEGWDFPACEVMILARPTRSLIRYIQMAGRILRPFEGKEKSILLDHSGTCKRLGFPTDDLPLFLDDGKPRDKKEAAKKEKKREENLPLVCPTCFCVLAKPTTCPKCGYVFPKKKNTIETKDGELVKIKKGKGKIKNIPREEREKIYAELKGYAQQRGYKEGWAWYKCREIFGTGPRSNVSAVNPTESTLNLITHLRIKNAKRREASLSMR